VEFFLLTFPYYPEIGYLFDRGDLDFYLGKQGYSVSVSGEVFGGKDRVSLLTFMCMYALLKSGAPDSDIDEILNDSGLVLSDDTPDSELSTLKRRIDEFNDIIKAAESGHVHIIDIGAELNEMITSGRLIEDAANPYTGVPTDMWLNRNWGRGNAFSLDGVHLGYTVHGIIANAILGRMNAEFPVNAQKYNLAKLLETDPYVDWDGDGWVRGADYKASGRTKILFLFKDIEEGVHGDAVIDTISDQELWELISDALVEEVISIPLLRLQAERMGLVPIKEINQ